MKRYIKAHFQKPRFLQTLSGESRFKHKTRGSRYTSTLTLGFCFDITVTPLRQKQLWKSRCSCNVHLVEMGGLNPAWSTASPFYCAALPVIWQVLLPFSWWVIAGDFHDLVDIIYQISTKSIAYKRGKYSGICLIYILILSYIESKFKFWMLRKSASYMSSVARI